MEERESIFPKVFLWMFIGLLVSFGVGYYVFDNPNMLYNIGKNWTYIVIAELGIAILFSCLIKKMNAMVAKILYILYSFTTGLTLSIIFAVYTMDSIIYIFGITSVLFLLFALYGYKTKKDLTKLGTILMMMLFGVIIAGIVNIFLNNTMTDLVICVIGIIVFIGFIAYDIQKVKYIAAEI